ncbi:uncharacterized protein si:ch211-13c6.2 isoform X2 [Puntigrus tetrazona]|nr:uncharacterized protein si:ch211-13c6.2 isoform X2 [Puntigrus tetrazona]
MCVVEMDLYSMVAHIVGRKHRQKYLELKRPDLVTWQDNNQKQPGLVARAKAAVVEKQEGWGKPVALKRPQEKFRNVFQGGSDLRASVHEQPYYGQEPLRKPPFPEQVQNQMYLDEEQHGSSYYTGDNYDQCSRPKNPTHDVHQQFYPEENQHQKHYENADVRGRHSRGDGYSEREVHTRPYAEQGGRRLQEYYKEESLGGGQFSGGKINRFNDKDLRIRPGASEYQKDQVEGRRYAGYEERNPAMNPPMSMQGRSFNEEKRGTVREMHSRPWDKANEVQGYLPMLQPRDSRAYSHEAVPAKKKKKSRFSDATAEEIAHAHMRHSDKSTLKEKPRGQQFRANPPPLNIQYMGSGSTTHLNPKHENVLDILSDIKIDNMDEARFLKEKLCTVLKEFQENKSRSIEGHASQSVGDHRGVKQTRDDPNGMHLGKRGFPEARRYDDGPRSFQESRQYGDDPRMFREVQQIGDDPRGLRETRHYEGDYKESKRFEGYPSGLQEERPYANDHPERRRYDEDPRQKEQHFEEYSRASRAEAPRNTQETRYYEDDYRGFGNLDPQRNWENQKGRSLERFENRGPADVERGFQASLQEEARMYAGRAQQRSHQSDCHPGDEPYDPFNPSSSPPPEASSSTSLDKIASTLLELVARR